MMDGNSLKMSPPETGVKVRMYRLGGLGDCFLLAFPAQDGAAKYMLMDCGVFLGTEGGADRMRLVARDIEAATGGHIDILVATHEHWDHLAGFSYAKEIFDRIQIDEAWLAWTEDPFNPLAAKLRQKRAFALKALNAAVNKLRLMDDSLADPIEELVNFSGGFDIELGISKTSGQIEYVRNRAKAVRFLRPKDPPLELDSLPGVRIFTLGPPEDEKLLSRSEPSGAEGEVYELAEPLNQASAFSAAAISAVSSLSPAGEDIFDRSLPFDRSDGIPLDKAANHAEFGGFFSQYYGFSDEPGQGPKWRRIDADWLGAAGELALALDNDTNNTSLVLAFELVPSGKVLLFPGDAQVGNWLSWQSYEWQGGQKCTTTTGPNLLSRTVLYKVGHHGSHNATLQKLGLELMVRPDLVAMIPVDAGQADKKRWKMPFEPLYQRLQEKTRGRILRADQGLPEKPALIPDEQWNVFTCCVSEDESPDRLWLEYTVFG